MITFSEFLVEQAQAKKGNWKESQGWFISATTKLVTELNSDYVDTITIPGLNNSEFEFRQFKGTDDFILGYWDSRLIETKLGDKEEIVFVSIFTINLTLTNLGFGHYKNVVNVDGVAVDLAKKLNGKGISLLMYKYLVKALGYTILGDTEQYFGARKLWSKLSSTIDIKVDIINTKTKEIEIKNVILHHGDYNGDFDKRLWSYSKDKNHLRSILTDILD